MKYILPHVSKLSLELKDVSVEGFNKRLKLISVFKPIKIQSRKGDFH